MSGEEKNTLFLLDGMALIYRAHFAFIRRPIYNSKGFNTSALMGFTNALVELLTNRSPTHLAVAMDTRAPTARHKIFPEYKVHREAMPEDLSAALPYMEEIVAAFRIPILKLDGYEADDIIGTLADWAGESGVTTYMVTPDKDFGQLVGDRVFIYRPSQGGDAAEIQGVKEVRERWGIERPEQVIDMLGLCGDVADNIPGVPKIGPKSAQKLIAVYGTLENLLEHVSDVKGKQGEQLAEYADQARLSKQLATIDRRVPIAVDWDDLKVESPDRIRLSTVFSELEFRSLKQRLLGDDAVESQGGEVGSETAPLGGGRQSIAEVPHEYISVHSAEGRRELISKLKHSPSFCFDLETTSLDPKRAEIIGIAFAVEAHKGYFAWFSRDREDARRELIDFLEVFADEGIEKVGHNCKYDLAVLRQCDVDVAGPVFDTMLAHALVEPEMRHKMDVLAETYLNYSPVPITQLIGEEKGNQIGMEAVDREQLKEYAVEDADVTWQLREILIPMLAEKSQERVFYEVEAPLIRVLVGMEHEGVALDCEVLASFSVELAGIIEEKRREIFEEVGHPLNLNSPKQLGVVLFEELRLSDKPKKTKTGQYATNEQVLSRLAAQNPIVSRILDYRAAVKLKNTYVDMLPQAIFPGTGRVHTNYGQLHTATGRIQSDRPNLQNIPVRTALGREIRKAFVPRSGEYLILSADYSQIELRVIAALSGDDGLQQAFACQMDIHRATAARIFGVSPEDVTTEMRGRAKMVNFGIPYGISAFGLSQRLGIPRKESAAMIAQYFSQFPKVRDYIGETLEFCRSNGYVQTITGRRRYLRDINSANGTTRASAERNAINMPIQGTSADMIKIAMARIWRSFQERNLRTKLLLQVHDELVFELFRTEEETVVPLVRDGMAGALELGVPITVDIGMGENWLEAH
jgi:DNA polymerase-1